MKRNRPLAQKELDNIRQELKRAEAGELEAILCISVRHVPTKSDEDDRFKMITHIDACDDDGLAHLAYALGKVHDLLFHKLTNNPKAKAAKGRIMKPSRSVN